MASTVRVMTFNVQGATWPKDGPNAWPERAELNVATIRRWAPDLVGLQEAQEANLRAYRDGLPGYALFRGNNYGDVPPRNGRRCCGTPTGSPWSKAASSGSARRPTGRRAASAWSTRWARRGSACAIGALGRSSRTSTRTSRTARTASARAAMGARLIVEGLDRLQADGTPAIVTGDFNCNPDSAPHAAFLAAGFADAHPAAGHADGVDSTYHCFEGPAYSAERYSGGANAFWRIDWVLTRGGSLRTATCTIVRDADPPRYPSDHYPVLADLLQRTTPDPAPTD